MEVQLSSQEPEELKCESCNQSSQTDNVEELTLLEESTEEPPLEKTEETDAEIEDNCNSCKTKECRINNLVSLLYRFWPDVSLIRDLPISSSQLRDHPAQSIKYVCISKIRPAKKQDVPQKIVNQEDLVGFRAPMNLKSDSFGVGFLF